MNSNLNNQTINKLGFVRDSHCTFCQEMDDGSVTPNYKKLFPKSKPESQIVAENESWYVIPDDSPIKRHHLLLVSKNHAHSWANLDTKSANDLIKIRDDMSRLLLNNYPDLDLFYFEHGSGVMEDGRPIHCGACGSHVHAHIHIIPFEEQGVSNLIDFINEKVGQAINTQPIDLKFGQTPEKSDNPYLYIASAKSGGYLYPTDLKNACLTIPSQYIRSLIGEFFKLKPAEWDYKLIFSHNSRLAKQRIQSTISLFKNLNRSNRYLV